MNETESAGHSSGDKHCDFCGLTHPTPEALNPLKMVTSAHVDTKTGELLLNGERFRYYLADESVQVEAIPGGPKILRISILVDGDVEIL